MSGELFDDIRFERGQLEQTVTLLGDLLASGEPFDPPMTAFAAVNIHSFYNGIENVLRMLARLRGQEPPQGERWHQRLLDAFAEEPGLPLGELRELMAFRHVFRNAYFFDLRADRVHELVRLVVVTWPSFDAWLDRQIEDAPR